MLSIYTPLLGNNKAASKEETQEPFSSTKALLTEVITLVAVKGKCLCFWWIAMNSPSLLQNNMQLLLRCQLGKGEGILCSWERRDSFKTRFSKGIILSSDIFLPEFGPDSVVTLTKPWVPCNNCEDIDSHPHLNRGQQGLDVTAFFNVLEVYKARFCYQHKWEGSLCRNIT